MWIRVSYRNWLYFHCAFGRIGAVTLRSGQRVWQWPSNMTFFQRVWQWQSNMTFFLTPFIPLCFSRYCSEARACCVGPVGLEPAILLPQPDEYQDIRHEPLCLVLMQHFKRMCFLSKLEVCERPPHWWSHLFTSSHWFWNTVPNYLFRFKKIYYFFSVSLDLFYKCRPNVW